MCVESRDIIETENISHESRESQKMTSKSQRFLRIFNTELKALISTKSGNNGRHGLLIFHNMYVFVPVDDQIHGQLNNSPLKLISVPPYIQIEETYLVSLIYRERRQQEINRSTKCILHVAYIRFLVASAY